MRRPNLSALTVHVRGRLVVPVAVVGIGGGLLGAAYVTALHLLGHLLGPDGRPWWAQATVLVATGAILAVGTRALGPTGDVELLVDNIHIDGGPRGVRELRSLVPLSLVSVASGAPLGPEAPLVQTSGTWGSALARVLHLDRSDTRVLTITGMAAGFTVLFGAPLGAALFALEILHRRGLQYYEALVPALVGSLSGYAVFVTLTQLGLAPVWSFPRALPLAPSDLGWAIVAGVVGAVLAMAFTGTVVVARRLARHLPPFARPVIAGLLLAALAAWSGYALTFGEGQVDELLAASSLTAGALLTALVAKLLAIAVALAGEWKGGFVIPLLFLGAAAGQLVHTALPSTAVAVVTAGVMVAALTGVTNTPVGSTLVVSEMAGLTLLPTTVVAALVALALTRPITLIETQRARESSAVDRRRPADGPRRPPDDGEAGTA